MDSATRARGRQAALRLSVAAVASALAVGLTPAAASAAPATPTAASPSPASAAASPSPTAAPPSSPAPDGAAVTAAVATADVLAGQIGDLTAKAAAAQKQLDDAHAASAIALDDYQATEAAYETARARSDAAAAASTRATALLRAARAAVVDFARHSYMQGSTDSRTAALLTSGDPSQLIERAALLEAAGNHQSTVFDQVEAAREESVRTAAVARATFGTAQVLKARAEHALAVAKDAELRARAEAAGLLAQQIGLDRRLSAARSQLSALIGPKAAADRLAGLLLAANPGGTPPLSTFPDNRPLAGAGSPSVAAAAIDAAIAELGTPYAWGGGGARGPGPGLPPDQGVVGFDCSGLTQYAYARAGVAIARNSRAQFASLPRVPVADLQPGDLVFWATDPADPRTIHHVALYLGQGRVLQSPESGDIVTVSAMWWTGYAGAARPTG